MEQDHPKAPTNILTAVDRRHYSGIHGAACLAVREDDGHVQARIQLLVPLPIDERWIKRIELTFIDRSTDYRVKTAVDTVEPHQSGYGLVIETSWVYTVTGLAHFDPPSSRIELHTPTGKLITFTPFFPFISSYS